MKNIYLFIIFILALIPFCSATNYFEKEFGDSALINYGNSVQQLPGGSIFFAGSSNSNFIGGSDLSLTKLDAEGNFIWRKYFGTANDDFCSRMIVKNNILIICGQSYNNTTSTADGILLAVDTNGIELWQHNYGSSVVSEAFFGVCSAINGGYLVCGIKSGLTQYSGDFWLVKTDSSGNLQWETTYGDQGVQETSDAIVQLSNGDIFISGDKGISTSAYNAWIVKTDSLGNEIWDRLMSNPNNGGCKNICFSSDNLIYVIGEAATDSSADFDIQVSKIDTSGNLRWVRYITATNQSDAGFDMKETDDHKFMITGYYFDTMQWQKRIPMILIDTSGNELGRKLFGTTLQNIGYEIIQSVNGGFLIGGTDFMNGQCILIYNNVTDNDGIDEIKNRNTIAVYPNPAFNQFNVHLLLTGGMLEVLDISGRNIMSVPVSETDFNIDASMLKSGIYILRLNTGQNIIYSKLIIE